MWASVPLGISRQSSPTQHNHHRVVNCCKRQATVDTCCTQLSSTVLTYVMKLCDRRRRSTYRDRAIDDGGVRSETVRSTAPEYVPRPCDRRRRSTYRDRALDDGRERTKTVRSTTEYVPRPCDRRQSMYRDRAIEYVPRPCDRRRRSTYRDRATDGRARTETVRSTVEYVPRPCDRRQSTYRDCTTVLTSNNSRHVVTSAANARFVFFWSMMVKICRASWWRHWPALSAYDITCNCHSL